MPTMILLTPIPLDLLYEGGGDTDNNNKQQIIPWCVALLHQHIVGDIFLIFTFIFEVLTKNSIKQESMKTSPH